MINCSHFLHLFKWSETCGRHDYIQMTNNTINQILLFFLSSNSSYLKNKNKIFKNGVLIVIVACSCSSILHWNPNRAKKRWWNHSYSTNDKAYYVGTKCVRDILIPFTIKTVVNYSQLDLKRPTKTDFKFTTDITDGFPV